MKIELNRNRCEGHAMCEASAPSYFSVDDDGTLTVLSEHVQEPDKADVQSAVLSCPVAALKLST